MAKEDLTNEIKKNLEQKKLVIGTEMTVKSMRREKLSKVYLTSNCPADVRQDIERYAKLANVAVAELGLSNEELGVVCKKPFSISVIGLLKV
jgi:large subunit ribosomal protein L30e